MIKINFCRIFEIGKTLSHFCVRADCDYRIAQT